MQFFSDDSLIKTIFFDDLIFLDTPWLIGPGGLCGTEVTFFLSMSVLLCLSVSGFLSRLSVFLLLFLSLSFCLLSLCSFFSPSQSFPLSLFLSLGLCVCHSVTYLCYVFFFFSVSVFLSLTAFIVNLIGNCTRLSVYAGIATSLSSS